MSAKKKTDKVDTEENVAENKPAEEVIETAETPETETELKEEAGLSAEASAKAGKRSKKGIEEAEEKAKKLAKQAKNVATDETSETDKAQIEDEEVVKKGPKPKVRPLIERRSRRYQDSAKKIEKGKDYPLAEAVKLAKETSTVKFDATVELHVKLNVDPKQADQNVRASVVLPNGTGKTQVVAVYCDDETAKKAKAAGADFAGEDIIIDKLKKEEFDFDVLITSPEQMSKLGKFAKALGPKGLMPNPKSGTVTKDIVKAIKEAKAGRVEFRVDKQGIIHTIVGKVSFDDTKLTENLEAVVQAIKDARPASVKSTYILGFYLTTAMGPSVKFQV